MAGSKPGIKRGQYRKKISIEDRFWSKIINKPEDPNMCWEYTGQKNNKGYGLFSIGHKDKFLAHRIGYELQGGVIPEGLVLDHICRNTLCVRKSHLEPVTFRENVLRGIGFSAKNYIKTHCIHGHEFTKENIIHRKLGRQCKKCSSINTNKYNEKIKLKNLQKKDRIDK